MTEIERRLTQSEARALTDEIRGAAEQTYALMLRAHEGQAWTALGYETWRDYAMTEFGMSQSHAYRLLDQARVVREIESASSPIGEIPSESQARELAKVPEGERAEVWRETVERTNGKPTAAAVRETYAPTPAEPEPAPTRLPITAEQLDELKPENFQPPPVVDQPDQWTDDERLLQKLIQAGETVVVSQRGQHNNLISWANSAGLYVRIDRRTEWGNPFELPGDGDRDTVIRNYEQHYLPHKPSLLSKLDSLRGKALGCWCAPEQCHGDVLKARAEQ